tara:strand:+ start:740 stop:1450 length:711 start_codon:yes stop_codon:yes gene_type:complete
MNNLNYDIINYILNIRTNDLELDVVNKELSIRYYKDLIIFIYENNYIIDFFDCSSSIYLNDRKKFENFIVSYKYITYKPYINKKTDIIFNTHLKGNIKIIQIFNNKIIYISNILKNPNLLSLLKISNFIYYNVLSIKPLDSYDDNNIYINKFKQVYQYNNIKYYIIHFDWEFDTLIKMIGINNLVPKYYYKEYKRNNSNFNYVDTNVLEIINTYQENYLSKKYNSNIIKNYLHNSI